MQLFQRRVQQNTVIHSDRQTGEVISETKENVSYIPKEPAYVKLYLDDIARLYGLPKAGGDLLHALLKKMDYEGIITLVTGSKKRIAEELNIKIQTLDNNLQSLLKADILRRVSRGEFMFNPEIVAKGDWKNIYKQRNKYLQLTMTYSSDGKRTIKSELKTKE